MNTISRRIFLRNTAAAGAMGAALAVPEARAAVSSVQAAPTGQSFPALGGDLPDPVTKSAAGWLMHNLQLAYGGNWIVLAIQRDGPGEWAYGLPASWGLDAHGRAAGDEAETAVPYGPFRTVNAVERARRAAI